MLFLSHALQHFGGGKPQFKHQMELLALRLMRNPLRQSELHGPPRELTPPLSQRASPPQYVDHSSHTLVPLSTIPGFKPREQQRCQMCNKPTSWACAECSKGCQCIVPIHPSQTNKHGQIRYWTCLCEHRANPFIYPRNRAKRVRSSPSSE